MERSKNRKEAEGAIQEMMETQKAGTLREETPGKLPGVGMVVRLRE